MPLGRRLSLVLFVAGVYILHQDFWNWDAARPLLWGFLPVGLWYHGAYILLCAAVMALLVRWCWPAHLDREPER
jgi:hypothetical protein